MAETEPGRVELQVTGDDSHTLLSHRFGVTYHSRHGAIEEGRHVFIRAGVEAVIERPDRPATIRVFEMGFGTGLNALLLREYAARNPQLQFVYTGYEQFPVPPEVLAALNYPEQLGIERSRLEDLHQKDWGRALRLDPNYQITVYKDNFLAADLSPLAATQDVIFYDAFAPNNQPELWSTMALERAFTLLRPAGVLVTYCAKGQFKRDLRSVGFAVEALPGPPGKREMTRATR